MNAAQSVGDLASLGAAEATTVNDVKAPQHFTHPEAATMFHAAPCTEHIPIFNKSCEGFGPRCVTSLGLCYFLNKGLGNNLMSFSRFAMFTDRFGIDGTRYQRLSSISNMAFSIKAFSAVLSDTFAIFGYTKRWVCGGSCVVGAAFALAFGLLPQKPSSADMAAGFLFLSNFCMANVDILSEGHYSRLMRRHPGSGPALVSWIWWFMLIASLVAACIQGPLSDMKKPQVGLFVSGAAQVISVVFFILNWYGEQRNRVERLDDARALHIEIYKLQMEARDEHKELAALGAEPVKHLHPEQDNEELSNRDAPHHLSDDLLMNAEMGVDDEDDDPWATFQEPTIIPLCCAAVEFNKGVCLRNWRVLIYSAVMVCSVVAMTCVTILGTTWDLFYAAIAVAVVNCGMAFWATSLVIAKAIVFIYFNMLLYLQLNGAMDSFYMAKEECYPDGPHFTYVFYNTVASVIGNLAGIGGVTAFAYIFSKHNYCMTFVVTTSVQMLASIFDIVIVKRWNLYIGIPDHAMYILGDSIVYQVCYYLAWMPMVLLLSRICPRGSESMIYALVAGSGNLGAGMATTIGSILLEKAWPIVTTGAGRCDFHNLPMLLVVGHFCLPLLIVPLSFLLLPSARICDDIDVDGHVVRAETKRRAAMLESSSSLDDGLEEPHNAGSEGGDERMRKV